MDHIPNKTPTPPPSQKKKKEFLLPAIFSRKEKVTAKVIYTQHADLWSVFENKKKELVSNMMSFVSARFF